MKRSIALLLLALIGLTFFWMQKHKSPEMLTAHESSELITIICTTNPIPSIPLTNVLNESMKSLQRIPPFQTCKKIIVFDGIQPGYEEREKDYTAYKENVQKLVETEEHFANTELIFCPSWMHLSGAIEKALEQVTTPYVFIHQHDFVLLKEFSLEKLLTSMNHNHNIKYVRLNQWKRNLPRKKRGHHYSWDGDVDRHVEGGSFTPLSRTFGWSDNDHISRTDYYRDFVLPKCGFGAMEWYLNPLLKKAIQEEGLDEGHLPFGTYLLGDLRDGRYIYHSDGREVVKRASTTSFQKD